MGNATIKPDKTWPENLIAAATITVRQGIIDLDVRVQRDAIWACEEMSIMVIHLPPEVFQPLHLLDIEGESLRDMYEDMGLPPNTDPQYDSATRRHLIQQAHSFMAEMRRILDETTDFTAESPRDLAPLGFNLSELACFAVTHVCLACKGNPTNAAYHLRCVQQLLHARPDISAGFVHPLHTLREDEISPEAWPLVQQLVAGYPPK